MFRYRVAERRWQRVAPLPSPRFNHALVAFDGGLWAIGGYWTPHASSEVFVYDPAADRWRRGPALPHQVQTAAAVVYRGDLWLIGGRRGTKPLTEVQVLRPGGKSWRPGPAMPKPMELLGADVSRDRIHALWEGTYQVYDPATGWALGPSPQVPRHSVALFATDRDLVAVGGCTVQLEDSNVVERLALATGGASH